VKCSSHIADTDFFARIACAMLSSRSLYLVCLLACRGLSPVEAQTGHPFPTPKTTAWVKGNAGESCDEVCAVKTRGTHGCAKEMWINSSSVFQAVLKNLTDTSCTSFSDEKKSVSPGLYTTGDDAGTCYWDVLAGTSDGFPREQYCSRNNFHVARFCACWPVQHLMTTTTTTPLMHNDSWRKRMESEMSTLRAEVSWLKKKVQKYHPEKTCKARGGCVCDCSWAKKGASFDDDGTCCFGCCILGDPPTRRRSASRRRRRRSN